MSHDPRSITRQEIVDDYVDELRTEIATLRRELDVVRQENERLRGALKFYATREHWMALTDDPSEPRKLLVANGDTESVEGWAMADAALKG